MKHSASGVLVEQLIMVLVFALAASACLGIFAAAYGISQSTRQQDAAVQLCENAVEILKASRGDLKAAAEFLQGSVSEGTLLAFYDAQLQSVPSGCYCLAIRVIPVSGLPMGQADLTVTHSNDPDTPLFSLRAAWQEVSCDAS